MSNRSWRLANEFTNFTTHKPAGAIVYKLLMKSKKLGGAKWHGPPLSPGQVKVAWGSRQSGVPVLHCPAQLMHCILISSWWLNNSKLRKTWYMYTLCLEKIGPIRLIWHNFTNSQHILIIFGRERDLKWSILNWCDKSFYLEPAG